MKFSHKVTINSVYVLKIRLKRLIGRKAFRRFMNRSRIRLGLKPIKKLFPTACAASLGFTVFIGALSFIYRGSASMWNATAIAFSIDVMIAAVIVAVVARVDQKTILRTLLKDSTVLANAIHNDENLPSHLIEDALSDPDNSSSALLDKLHTVAFDENFTTETIVSGTVNKTLLDVLNGGPQGLSSVKNFLYAFENVQDPNVIAQFTPEQRAAILHRGTRAWFGSDYTPIHGTSLYNQVFSDQDPGEYVLEDNIVRQVDAHGWYHDTRDASLELLFALHAKLDLSDGSVESGKLLKELAWFSGNVPKIVYPRWTHYMRGIRLMLFPVLYVRAHYAAADAATQSSLVSRDEKIKELLESINETNVTQMDDVQREKLRAVS